MGFLQPLALLGLAAAAIPALLHLLQRRIPPTVVFPAVRYLSETERRHSRRLKLRNLLLLILRTALIIAIVLAAARPVAPLPFGRVHGASALAIVLDNSLSSGAVVQGRRTVDLIADWAQQAVQLSRAGDRVWMIFADGIPRRVSRAEAVVLLDSLTPQSRRLDLGEAVRTGARIVADDELPGEVLVISDLQQSALTLGEEAAAPVFLLGAPALSANRGVDSVRLSPAMWTEGGTVLAAVGGSAGSGEVRLEIDGEVASRGLAEPGQVAALGVDSVSVGWHVARVLVGPDEMRADDQWYFAIRRLPAAPASASPGVGAFVREALDVLRSAGRSVPGVGVALADRVASGTSVVFAPGDPALIGAVNRDLASRGVAWRLGELQHGEWAVTSGPSGALGSRVYRRYALRGTGLVVARVGSEPWIVRDRDVVIVASRMDQPWTSLPVSAGFVSFLDELINRVAAAPSTRLTATPGATVELPENVSSLVGPQGRLSVSSDRRMQAPNSSGVYFLVAEAGDTVGALEVNHDPRESRLESADGDALRAALGSEVRLIEPGRIDRTLFQTARRADLTGALLVLALLLGLIELLASSVGGGPKDAS